MSMATETQAKMEREWGGKQNARATPDAAAAVNLSPAPIRQRFRMALKPSRSRASLACSADLASAYGPTCTRKRLSPEGFNTNEGKPFSCRALASASESCSLVSAATCKTIAPRGISGGLNPPALPGGAVDEVPVFLVPGSSILAGGCMVLAGGPPDSPLRCAPVLTGCEGVGLVQADVAASHCARLIQ